MNALTHLTTALGHALWRPWLRRRLGRTVLEEIDGVPLLILPEVFHPVVFRSGTLLARTVASAPELAPSPQARALDLGTGSGVGAVFAARRGYRVVAADVNPQAVRCARINAFVNAVEERVEARQGDLFEPVAGTRFDLVLFNPPYYEGRPRSALDAAWRGQDVLERFADGLPAALAPRGRALLVLSTDGAGGELVTRLADGGFAVDALARRAFGNEVLTAWHVRRSAEEGPS